MVKQSKSKTAGKKAGEHAAETRPQDCYKAQALNSMGHVIASRLFLQLRSFIVYILLHHLLASPSPQYTTRTPYHPYDTGRSVASLYRCVCVRGVSQSSNSRILLEQISKTIYTGCFRVVSALRLAVFTSLTC